MISQTVENALRAVVCLAPNPDKPLTNVEIARLTMVPEHYLSKVLHALVKGRIVRSQRRLHGGYILTQAIDKLPLLDISNAVDHQANRKLPPEAGSAWDQPVRVA